MALTILQIAFDRIWTNRNTLTFEGTHSPVRESIHIIDHQFRTLLREQFALFYPSRLAAFRTQFCHTPQICHVRTDESLQVQLL